MKIIEAMKQIKDLQLKAEDLREKAAKYGADLDVESLAYGTEQDQREQVRQWVQSHGDILKEILRLRVAIQRTNLATPVQIELDGKRPSKSIAEWIHRRRDLANLEREIFAKILAKANTLRAGNLQMSSGEIREVKIRRYFDQAEYDQRMEPLRSEPLKIDGTLEVVNAVTDLMEE